MAPVCLLIKLDGLVSTQASVNTTGHKPTLCKKNSTLAVTNVGKKCYHQVRRFYREFQRLREEHSNVCSIVRDLAFWQAHTETSGT